MTRDHEHRINFSHLSPTELQRLKDADPSLPGHFLVTAALQALEAYSNLTNPEKDGFFLLLSARRYNLFASILGWALVDERELANDSYPWQTEFSDDIQRHPEEQPDYLPGIDEIA